MVQDLQTGVGTEVLRTIGKRIAKEGGYLVTVKLTY